MSKCGKVQYLQGFLHIFVRTLPPLFQDTSPSFSDGSFAGFILSVASLVFECPVHVKCGHGRNHGVKRQSAEILFSIRPCPNQFVCLFKCPAQCPVFVGCFVVWLNPSPQQRCVIYQAAETDWIRHTFRVFRFCILLAVCLYVRDATTFNTLCTMVFPIHTTRAAWCSIRLRKDAKLSA